MATRVRLSEDRVNRYRDSLTLAHQQFDAEARPKIELMTKYFKGDQWPAVGKDASIPRVVANLLFADIKVMLPVLALRNPKVFVKPVGATVTVPMPGPNGKPVPTAAQLINGKPVPALAAAHAKENLINWRWRDLRINKQVRRCLVDSLLAPFGIMKLGYTLKTEKVVAETDEAELLEVNEAIKGDSPFAVRWSPLDFRVDPEARYPDLSDAGWIAFGWLARLDDIKRNPRYKNTRDLKATIGMKTDYTGVGGPMRQYDKVRGRDEDFMRVQMWEMWDKREGKLVTLADDHEKVLQFDDWPLKSESFPAETLAFTEHPDCLYGPPDLYQIIYQQDAYNELSSMILNHVKRFLRKYVASRGAFDEKEMAKLVAPVDGVVIESDAKLTESIIPVPDAAIPVDWWQARGNYREDHDRISGIADFIRGVAEKVDTATEASLLQSNLNVRTNDSRDIVEDFAERVSKQLLAIDAQTVDIPKVIPVIGPDGALALGQFLRVQTRETLLAETDIEVEIGSMQPISEIIKKQDVLQVFQLLRNDPLVDQFALRKQLTDAYKSTIPGLDRLFIERDVFQQVSQYLQAQQGSTGPEAPKVSISLKGDLSPTLAADLADGQLGGDTSGHPPAPLPPPPATAGGKAPPRPPAQAPSPPRTPPMAPLGRRPGRGGPPPLQVPGTGEV